VKVYLEATKRRTFAVAVEWPGWARSGKTEEAALQALVDYGARYKKALGTIGADLGIPADARELEAVERLEGNATTEFGAPGVIAELDRTAVAAKELDRLIGILQASWRAFERVADEAAGHELGPSGPRGGGRELAKIRDHVAGAEAGYTSAVGGKARESDPWNGIQDAFVTAVRARARGELPDVGPRGGQRWPARFAIRRSAWHALDHAWEIADRLEG
jgi:hypothetical protein